jgi:arylsulfatase A-like enzyme
MPTLLITVDALRADRLGQYGYHRDTMPVLDELVAAGTLFERAFANGPYTRVSVPSFHTSRYLAYGDVGALPTIPAALGDAGVRTAAIGTQTGIGLVRGEYGYDELIDLGRDGFERGGQRPPGERVLVAVDDVATSVSEWLQRRGMDRVYRALKRPYDAVVSESKPERAKGYTSAEAVTDRAVEWLDEHDEDPDPNGEFFLWLHYMEAHRPYGIHDTDPEYLDGPVDNDRIRDLMRRAGTAPGSLSAEEVELMRDLYDSDLRYCSRHLRRLFDALRDRGLFEESDIVFSSDHGEEFREHGRFFHRNFPYDELIHVPLVVARAGGGATEPVAEQRELLDLAPTICGFHDVDASGYSFRGTPLFEGGPRDVIALGQPGMDEPALAVRADGWKYIHTDAAEQLYDLESDPDEREDVVATTPDTARRLRRLVPEYLFGRDTKAPRPPEDDVDREQLAALGYMELREDEGSG